MPALTGAPAAIRRRPVRVLELRSVRGTGGGPDKTILAGAARTDPSRFAITVCYVRDERDACFGIEARARQMGIGYEEIRERHSFDRRIWPALVDLVRRHGIDIIHAHEYKSDFLAFWLARRTGARAVATAHGWITNTPRERLYSYCDRRLLVRYPLVIAVSQPIRQTLIARGADPSRVRRIPNGIDSRVFRRDAQLRGPIRDRLRIPSDALVIGSTGRLEREKRYDLLLRAVHALPPSLQPFVVLVGDGGERDALRGLAAQLGLSERIRLTGHQPDVRELQHAFDLYVQSSDTEGAPNAVLEAMALEIPVVATAVGGTPEVVEDGVHGLLVQPGDALALADAIAATVAHGGAAGARVTAARERVETELSFDRRQAAVERVYEELVS